MRREITGASACSPSAWEFCRAEEFWALQKPATPYASDFLARREAFRDKGDIIAAYDDTDAYGRFALTHSKESSRLDRIAWHLSRMPRLPSVFGGDSPGDDAVREEDSVPYDAVELFLFKKFLSNYRALLTLVDDEALKSRFGMEFHSEGLSAALDSGGSDPETFQVSERHDPGLAPLRARLRDLAEETAREKERIAEKLAAEWGLDFRGRDFLTLPSDEALKMAAACGQGDGAKVSVEPYDEHSFVVRPLPDARLLEAEREREVLREKEAELENRVLVGLSRFVRSERPNFARYLRAVLRFDLARTRYALAAELGLARPGLDSGGYSLSKGRFYPCEKDCVAIGAAYSPLDFTLSDPVAVLFGSNMGGKTVVLQTALFFQTIAQCGLFVPASSFATRVYRHIEYVGEGGGEKGRGLSGFGFEIRSLDEAWKLAADGPCMTAFDEFARSTGSEEAEALLSAVIEAFASAPGARSLFATHFMGVARLPCARYFRMAGLDLEKAHRVLNAPEESDSGPDDRIRLINRMMRYSVEEERPGGVGRKRSDAMEIASLLGLDGRIVAKAAEFGERRADAAEYEGKKPRTGP
ncbi:MAG: hypothetical protein WBH97_10610 [Rectinemataceae bacterium]